MQPDKCKFLRKEVFILGTSFDMQRLVKEVKDETCLNIYQSNT